MWIEDDEAPNCFVCKEEFGFFLRRHHCRRCGNVVCYKHSESQMVIPRLDPTALQRVCDTCKSSPLGKTPGKVKSSSSAGADNTTATPTASSNDSNNEIIPDYSVAEPGTPPRAKGASAGSAVDISDNSNASSSERVDTDTEDNRSTAARADDSESLMSFLGSFLLTFPAFVITFYCMARVMDMDMSQEPFATPFKIISQIQGSVIYMAIRTSNPVIIVCTFFDALIHLITSNQIYHKLVEIMGELGQNMDQMSKRNISEKMPWVTGFIVSFISLRFLYADPVKNSDLRRARNALA